MAFRTLLPHWLPDANASFSLVRLQFLAEAKHEAAVMDPSRAGLERASKSAKMASEIPPNGDSRSIPPGICSPTMENTRSERGGALRERRGVF